MDYNSAYASLAPVYDPLVQNTQTQIDALQPQQDAQQASLDQAKVNAFKDITNSANSKGMLFSGFTPDQQAQYIGTKYLPAVANLKTSFNNTKNTLLGQINTIQSERAKGALGAVSDYQKTQSDNAYKQAQLALGYARLNQSGGNAANNAANKLRAQYSVSGKTTTDAFGTKSTGNNNGYNFTGPNNMPISLAQYIDGIGGGVNEVKNLLANGSSYDKSIYKQVSKISDPGKLKDTLVKLDKSNYYGFQ